MSLPLRRSAVLPVPSLGRAALPASGLLIRRSAVIAGALLSVVLGVATIRAAAVWTASSAPLPAPTVSAQS
ncbi:MAG: hypothetical protein ACXWMX_04840, partial [Candidatus Limnocylindrales bacterium]